MNIKTITKTAFIWALVAASVSSCQSGAVGQNTAVGAGLGAVVGGLGCAALGGRTGTCLAIAGAGALVGGAIGAQIDARDRERREMALQQVRRQARPVSWSNPQTGNRGTITPLRAVVQNERKCQVVRETYVKNGEPVTGESTVCS